MTSIDYKGGQFPKWNEVFSFETDGNQYSEKKQIKL